MLYVQAQVALLKSEFALIFMVGVTVSSPRSGVFTSINHFTAWLNGVGVPKVFWVKPIRELEVLDEEQLVLKVVWRIGRGSRVAFIAVDEVGSRTGELVGIRAVSLDRPRVLHCLRHLLTSYRQVLTTAGVWCFSIVQGRTP